MFAFFQMLSISTVFFFLNHVYQFYQLVVVVGFVAAFYFQLIFDQLNCLFKNKNPNKKMGNIKSQFAIKSPKRT